MQSDIAAKENIRRLVEGRLPWEEVKKLIRLSPKDADRFWNYLEVMQEKVPWKDKILLRITDNLFIVAKEEGGRVVKCFCSEELGDYRANWKLSCRIFARENRDEMAEVIPVDESIYNTDIVHMREYYCPGCLALLAVEVVPRGYPVVFDMLPDIDTLYRDWLGKPLADEGSHWYQDKSYDLTAQWGKEL